MKRKEEVRGCMGKNEEVLEEGGVAGRIKKEMGGG